VVLLLPSIPLGTKWERPTTGAAGGEAEWMQRLAPLTSDSVVIPPLPPTSQRAKALQDAILAQMTPSSMQAPYPKGS